jgi:anaphase-promoting complex subunit 1
MVMAGSGNLTIFSILEERHRSINSTTTYGNHLITHMSMGLLFVGGGEFTLGTSNRAIAAMVCAFYPRFPANSDDNRFHIQAYRHLWVLAVDKRCLVTQDVESGEICPVPIIVSVRDTFNPAGVTNLELVTPCILPDQKNILHIHFKSPRYWPFSLDIENVVHKNILMDLKKVPIKRRAGHLSYIDDPEGIKGIVAMSFPRRTQDERSVRIRDSFIKCLSANAQFIAFAKHFAYPSATFNDSDHFSSFCMNVLYDSLANDRPRIIRTYLWMHNILQDFKCLKNEDMWNLKIIIAIYLGDVEWPNFHPCLIQQDLLENIEIMIYDYFDEIAEEDIRFVECLKLLIMTDCLNENADPLVLNQVKMYISYFDWPSSFNKVRAATLNSLDSDIFDIARKIRQNLQDVPFKTILQIASKI